MEFEPYTIFLTILCGVFIGLMVTGFMSSTGEAVMVNKDFLNYYCKNQFGENYTYLDDTAWGIDENVTCHYIYEEIKGEEIDGGKRK